MLARTHNDPPLPNVKNDVTDVIAPIISLPVLSRMRELADQAEASAPRTDLERALYAGLPRCGVCGNRMGTGSDGRKRRYCCRKRPGESGCGKVSVLISRFDKTLEDFIAIKWREMTHLQERVRSLANRENDVELAEAGSADEVAEIESRLHTLARMWSAKQIDEAEWLAARSPLVAQRDALQATATRLAARPTRASLSLIASIGRDYAAWAKSDEATPALRREVASLLLLSVHVRPASRPYNVWRPGRVDARWKEL